MFSVALRHRASWTALAAGLSLLASARLPAQQAPTEIDPNSPLQPLPDLGVAWPDPIQAPLVEPATPATAAPATALTGRIEAPRMTSDAGKTERYTVAIEGTDAAGAATLKERFDDVSVLVQGAGKPANVAQIDRRAREDAETLRELLRAEGYYDAEVDTRVEAGADARIHVRLVATPGDRYRFASIALPGLDTAGADTAALRAAYAVKADDPVDADAVTAAQASLKTALGAKGYVFAEVPDPEIVVDHDAHEATLSQSVKPNGAKRFGKFELRGRKRLFTPEHVGRIARLHPGDRLNAQRIDDLRRALVATGLVSSVQLTPVQTADPNVADVVVRLEPAPPRTIAGEIGYGTGEGASVEINWQHRNLFPPEGGLTLRGVAGTQEQLASAQFRRGNFRERDQVLTAQIAAEHQDRPAFDAKTFTLAAGFERQTNIIWQKKWTWSLGGELIASDEKDVVAATGEPRRRTYLIGAIPSSLSYDGSDDLLNPSKGYRLSARVSPELSFQDGTFGYTKVQLDGSAYQPVSKQVVIAGRLRFGTIIGPSASRIAPSRRFYSGGGGSVRGFGYQKIGPRDIDNDPIGGKSLSEFGLEARIRFGDFGIVPFFDGGNLYASSLPRFTGFRYGAGLGARYYTSFGPIRVDVGTPVNPQKGDSRVAVYVSLGQAF